MILLVPFVLEAILSNTQLNSVGKQQKRFFWTFPLVLCTNILTILLVDEDEDYLRPYDDFQLTSTMESTGANCLPQKSTKNHYTEKTKLEGKLSLNTTCTCKDENEDYFRSYEYFDMTMTRATGKFKMSQ